MNQGSVMQYYLFHNQKRHGPFTLEQLVTQSFPSDALVWHQGLTDWVPPHEVPELRDNLPPTVPISAAIVARKELPAQATPQLSLKEEPEPGHRREVYGDSTKPRIAPTTGGQLNVQTGYAPTSSREGWAKLLAAVISVSIILIVSLVAREYAERDFSSTNFYRFLGLASFFVFYPVMKTALGRFIKK